MKKLICGGLVVLVLLSCLAGCNVTRNVSGPITKDAQATQKVEEMLAILAENRIEDAMDYMHPQVSETSEEGIVQVSDYLSGRKAESVELKNINITNSTGTAGKVRQEEVIYQVVLDDEEVIYLNVCYFSDNDGEGFSSFQVVLGVI